MPGLNGTGPRGAGPRTGRGLGSCARSYRRSPGGRFSGIAFSREATKEEEKETLKEELEAIKDRLKELEAK